MTRAQPVVVERRLASDGWATMVGDGNWYVLDLSVTRSYSGQRPETHGPYAAGMDGLDWLGSAMRAARAQLDVATHNLANVSSDGFRRAAAEVRVTAGGLIATSRTTHEQGAVRTTGRPFDLALLGDGAFHVGYRSSGGTFVTRDGAFTRDLDGYLVDDRGRRLHGARGALCVSEEAKIEADGTVRDRGRIVDRIPLPRGTHVLAGALETSTVNAIGEMLSILTAQRAFETAQKTLLAIDATREKRSNDIARVQ